MTAISAFFFIICSTHDKIFLVSSNIGLMGPFEVMADIQILRDHVDHVVFQLRFSDGLSIASLLL